MLYAVLDENEQVIGERWIEASIPEHKRQYFRPLSDNLADCPSWQRPQGFEWIVLPESVVKHFTFIDKDVGPLKKERCAAVDALFLSKLEQGFEYPTGSGKILQMDDRSRGYIDTIGQEARWAKLTSAPWPAKFGWRMLDNSLLDLPTPDDMIALGEAAKTEFLRLRRVSWVHKDAIAAMTDAQSVMSYDITTGW
jgi:hypothetical protein